MLVQAGSDDNYFADNDITHGGDGVFIRGPDGWASSGNVFERNDASYANNNCIEAQSPRQHLSPQQGQPRQPRHLGGLVERDDRRGQRGLLQRLAQRASTTPPWGFKYVPDGPQSGAAGIIMAGLCNHTICRGNKCIGNNGAGICLFGDASPKQPRFTAFHWVMENNVIRDNRWGIYMEFADWIDMAGNVMRKQPRRQHHQGRHASRTSRMHPDNPKITQPPKASAGPAAVGSRPSKWAKTVVLDASGSSDPGGNPLTFRWDFDDGTTATGPRVTHAFQDRAATASA